MIALGELCHLPNRALLLIVFGLLVCGLLQGCSDEEGIDPRIYGRWVSTDSIEKFEREAVIRYEILKDGSNAKMIKSTEYLGDDQPLTSAILGDQTYELKHLGPGTLEVNNVDKNVLSKTVCAFIDCESIVRYRFENVNTIVFTQSDGSEMAFRREE